jgi:trimeric autotransporter adhesin
MTDRYGSSREKTYRSRNRALAALVHGSTNVVATDIDGLDSGEVTDLIDSDYITTRITGGGGGGAFTIDADDNMISSNSSASPTAGSGLRNIIAGTGAGTSITTSDDNIMLGTNSGSNVTTGYQNTLVGHTSTAHVLASGDANTLVGYNAGTQVTGDYNTVVGSNTGGDDGYGNTTVGYGSTWQFDGYYNVTIGGSNYSQGTRTYAGGFVSGASAGYCVTVGYNITNSGQYGIAIGRQAATSGGDQIAIGRLAGTGNPVNTSKGSVSIGYWSGKDNEADNTVNIGYKSGQNFSSTANYNVNIGYEAASYTGYNPNSQYCVNIGYRAGLYARGDRNIAIGALTNGASNTAADARDNVCVGYYAGRVLTSGYENVFIGSNSDQTCQTGNANVIIGSTTNCSSTNAVAQVVLGYGINSQGNNTFRVRASSGSYNTQNASTWTTTSDERIKTNVTEYTLGLDTLNQINVKTYNYLSDSAIAAAHPELADSDGLVHEGLDTEKTIVGLMAQELEAVLPNSVTTRDNGIKAVNKDELFWVMLNSIKELKTANDSLVARVEALENAP